MASSSVSGMIGAGSAALSKVMAKPLGRFKSSTDGRCDTLAGAMSDDSINSIIEGDIIPRLLVAHSSGAAAQTDAGSAEIDPCDASRFATLPLELEAAGLLTEVDAFLAAGVSVEAVYLDLLAPAARRLGTMWTDDDCDFIDVTMGLWRLQEVMREIASRTPVRTGVPSPCAGRVLFAPVPGDQHYFGAIMIDEIFARAGWNSTVLPKPLRKELLNTLSHEPFDLVGLTLSRDCPSSALANLIKAMRKVSANPNISIMLGGHMINQNPAIVAEVGADGTGADARAALDVAQRLVQSAPARTQIAR